MTTSTTIAARIADALGAAGEPRPRVDILADVLDRIGMSAEEITLTGDPAVHREMLGEMGEGRFLRHMLTRLGAAFALVFMAIGAALSCRHGPIT